MSSLIPEANPPYTPTLCKVAVDTTYINPTWHPSKVEIRQESNAHEFARITTTVPPRKAVWSSGTPVTIEYGQALYDFNTFYGYLNHVEYLNSKTAELWCVGASYPLKNEKLKSWNKVTPSYIARSIAISHNLDYDVDQYEGLISEVQTGESDLAFLSRMADRIGFKFFIEGTVLHFINPLLPIRDIKTTVPSFWADPYNFTVKVGELVPGQGQKTNTSSYAIDSATGRVMFLKAEYDEFLAFGSSKSWNPIIEKYQTTNVSTSLDELRKSLNAEISNNLNWITAEVMLNKGSANLRSCSVIYIRGDISDQFTGFWLVDSIAKTLTPGPNGNWNYIASVKLMRDQLYGIISNVSLGQGITPKVSSTILKNGIWISDYVRV